MCDGSVGKDTGGLSWQSQGAAMHTWHWFVCARAESIIPRQGMAGDMRISYSKFLELLETDRVKRVIVYGDMKTAIVEVRVKVHTHTRTRTHTHTHTHAHTHTH